jgi:hypothetical protein
MMDNREHVTRAQRTCPRQQAGHMTEGRQPFTAEIKTLAKGLENNIDLAASPQRLGDERALSRRKTLPRAQESEESLAKTAKRFSLFHDPSSL